MTSPTPPSLRLDEAVARAAALTVDSMIVELDLTDPDGETFGSRTAITFRSTAEETFCEFRGRELISAQLNGVQLPPSCWDGSRVTLTGLQADNTLVVDGRMAYTHDGEGLHRHTDPADGQVYLYAMSFLDAAPRWFACFDQPDLKAAYEFTVRAPEHWTVVGNGPSTAVAPGRWQITPLAPLSTYFVTLVAGPYASVVAEHRGITLGFHVRASLSEQLHAEAEDLITVTRQCFDYYHDAFALPYPFGEYHQAFVPDFNAGAMENPGCVTLRDTMIFRGRATATERGQRAGIIAHEMAHMWFGDLVTLRWWDDLWLNESFAEYMAHRCCTEATRYRLWVEFGIVRKDWGAVADQSPSTHPVAANGALDAAAALQDFDGISYAKGAAVLKQLAHYAGDQAFLGGLNAYFARHAFGNATFADLIGEWQAAGVEDLMAWADAWLRTAGMDRIEVTGTADAPVITKTANGAERTHALTVASVDAAGQVQPVADLRLGSEPVAVTAPPGSRLILPDATDLTWAKIRCRDWPAVAAVLPAITDDTALVVIDNAIRDAVRDAELDPVDALSMVISSLPSTGEESVVSQMVGFAARSLAGPYAPVSERAGRLARVHQAASEMLEHSPAGSDRQLAAFRAAVRTAGDAGRLDRWRTGQDLPPGVSLDPELTWDIVQRLAVLGQADPIEAALTTDTSAAARAHAARARASLPTPAAKEAAWQLIMAPSSVGTYELYATGEGFFQPGQAELTAAYVPRYFTEISATAAFRSGWALGQMAAAAFPAAAATPEAVAHAERALAGDPPAPVRRALVDGTDQLRRAVVSLQRWGRGG